MELKLNEKPIAPFWLQDDMPHFTRRTGQEYCYVPYDEALRLRNRQNRLLDSLVEYLPEGAYIAGGFMTSVMQGDKNAKDVDFFFNSPEAFKATLEMFLNPPDDKEAWAWQGYTAETDLSKGFNDLRFVKLTHPHRLPVQLIKLVWYEDLGHVVDTFDFTVAQFGTDGTNVVMSPLGVMDLAHKKLVLHRVQFPASTLRRLIKYASKGYYACPGSLESIVQGILDVMAADPSLSKAEFVYLD